MKRVIVFLFAALIAACSGSHNREGVCYSFDERSCQGDPWNKNLPSGTLEEATQRAKSYFKNQGIDLISIDVNPSYHEIVCLACEICPAGPRYYIKVAEGSVDQLNGLNLLSLEEASECK